MYRNLLDDSTAVCVQRLGQLSADKDGDSTKKQKQLTPAIKLEMMKRELKWKVSPYHSVPMCRIRGVEYIEIDDETTNNNNQKREY